MESWNVRELMAGRRDQPSFHVASEKHLRAQFFRVAAGDRMKPYAYEGDILVTVFEGAVAVDGLEQPLGELAQAVVPAGESFAVQGIAETSLYQVVWTPPFASGELTD